jgi:hypothetical protein
VFSLGFAESLFTEEYERIPFVFDSPSLFALDSDAGPPDRDPVDVPFWCAFPDLGLD